MRERAGKQLNPTALLLPNTYKQSCPQFCSLRFPVHLLQPTYRQRHGRTDRTRQVQALRRACLANRERMSPVRLVHDRKVLQRRVQKVRLVRTSSNSVPKFLLLTAILVPLTELPAKQTK
jgi:hypothetical protein